MKVYRASGDNPKYPCQIAVVYDKDKEQALAAVYLAGYHQDVLFRGKNALEKVLAYVVYLTTTNMLSIISLINQDITGYNWPRKVSPGSRTFEIWQYTSRLLEKVHAIATVLVKFLKETKAQTDDLVQIDRIVPDADLIRSPSNLEYIQEWILEATNALTTLQAMAGMETGEPDVRVSSP